MGAADTESTTCPRAICPNTGVPNPEHMAKTIPAVRTTTAGLGCLRARPDAMRHSLRTPVFIICNEL